MPTKRKPSRASKLRPQHATTTDYDSDVIEPSDAAPTLPAPPPRTNTELNLAVLRRYSPEIECILSLAPFAVLYTFSTDTSTWEKCGVEGTLFVCQLTGYARYQVIILNRKSLDNFMTNLVSGDEVEITEEYVMLQANGEDGTPMIYGIWIFEDADGGEKLREVVAQTIQSCAMQAQIARESGVDDGDATNGHRDAAYEEQDEGEADVVASVVPIPQAAELSSISQAPGQRLDISQLFSSGPAAPLIAQPLPQVKPAGEEHGHARFTTSSDTDFFRNGFAPSVTQHQQPTPQTQQNALLSLFKK